MARSASANIHSFRESAKDCLLSLFTVTFHLDVLFLDLFLVRLLAIRLSKLTAWCDSMKQTDESLDMGNQVGENSQFTNRSREKGNAVAHFLLLILSNCTIHNLSQRRQLPRDVSLCVCIAPESIVISNIRCENLMQFDFPIRYQTETWSPLSPTMDSLFSSLGAHHL